MLNLFPVVILLIELYITSSCVAHLIRSISVYYFNRILGTFLNVYHAGCTVKTLDSITFRKAIRLHVKVLLDFDIRKDAQALSTLKELVPRHLHHLNLILNYIGRGSLLYFGQSGYRGFSFDRVI